MVSKEIQSYLLQKKKKRKNHQPERNERAFTVQIRDAGGLMMTTPKEMTIIIHLGNGLNILFMLWKAYTFSLREVKQVELI